MGTKHEDPAPYVPEHEAARQSHLRVTVVTDVEYRIVGDNDLPKVWIDKEIAHWLIQLGLAAGRAGSSMDPAAIIEHEIAKSEADHG